MPLDFPTSPTNGQAYNGYVYSTAIGAWQAKPSAQSPFYTGDTPPGNPVVGDSWFNTNDGTMYIYFNDGNTSQWVEHRSEIARSQVSLSPILPSSVSVSSGTASVGVNGLITFTNARDVNLSGIFTSSSTNYRIVINFSTSATSEMSSWFTNNGTNITTGYYGITRFSNYFVASNYIGTRNNGNGALVGQTGGANSNTNSTLEVWTSLTEHQYSYSSYARSYGAAYYGGYNTAGAADGFRISPLTGGVTTSGTILVQKYNY